MRAGLLARLENFRCLNVAITANPPPPRASPLAFAQAGARCGPVPWLATPDWSDRLNQSESVGGRAHESQCIRFVWSSGGTAYRDGGADAFSRHAIRDRNWHPKVL
jgi:hypothetical protein